MSKEPKILILKELMTIPGVGKSIADDLYRLGIHSVADLKGRNPETLYESFCRLEGRHVDRCSSLRVPFGRVFRIDKEAKTGIAVMVELERCPEIRTSCVSPSELSRRA